MGTSSPRCRCMDLFSHVPQTRQVADYSLIVSALAGKDSQPLARSSGLKAPDPVFVHGSRVDVGVH